MMLIVSGQHCRVSTPFVFDRNANQRGKKIGQRREPAADTMFNLCMACHRRTCLRRIVIEFQLVEQVSDRASAGPCMKVGRLTTSAISVQPRMTLFSLDRSGGWPHGESAIHACSSFYGLRMLPTMCGSAGSYTFHSIIRRIIKLSLLGWTRCGRYRLRYENREVHSSRKRRSKKLWPSRQEFASEYTKTVTIISR